MKKIILALLLAPPIFAWAQQTNWQQVALHSEKAVKKRLSSDVLVSPTWIDKSTFVNYHRIENGHLVRYFLDAKTGKREKLIADVPAFLKQYQQLTGDTAFGNNQLRYLNVQFVKGNSQLFTFKNKGTTKLFNRETGRLQLQETPKKSNTIERKDRRKYSYQTADSAFTMLGDQYNLYVRNNITGKTRQLTTDGKAYASYCHRSAKDTLLGSNITGSWYGHRFVCFVQDDSEVADLYIINALAKPRPRLKTKKMPLPNEKHVRQYKLFWYNADTDEAKLLPIEKFKDQYVELDDRHNGRDIYFTCRSRGVDTLQLCHLDVQTGKVRALITEVAKPHLNINEMNYRLVNHGEQIIWWSDRTGRGNYYLYDKNGKLLHRITQGEQLVASTIVHIDTLSYTMIFAGYGQEKGIDPNYRYFYRVALNGKHQQLLTPGDGTHSLEFSDDRQFAIDTYSRMDMPPVFQVIDVRHPSRRYEIKRANEQLLLAAGWIKPKLISVKAPDKKTELTGVMYLPSNFDATKKYPIISNVYPGPQADQVPRAFVIDDNGNQSLAELGFVVINVQPRGSSPIRDKAFYTYGYGNLRDYAVGDDKHTIETLAQRYPFIDLARVGIYGHSGGAAESVTALLTYPDFYKVAVAASGNHDNNIYIQWWGETYHGLKRVPTNMELAQRLKGKLLLISGDVDDNVPWASTLRMADALIKANKRFDFMVLPGMDHAVYGPYYDNLIRYYFRDHLLKLSPRDVDIVNHQ